MPGKENDVITVYTIENYKHNGVYHLQTSSAREKKLDFRKRTQEIEVKRKRHRYILEDGRSLRRHTVYLIEKTPLKERQEELKLLPLLTASKM